MNPETIQAIQETLAPITEKIGEGAGYGWEVIVKGQVAEGVGYTLMAIILLAIAVGILIFCYKMWQETNKYDDSLIMIFLAVLGVTLLSSIGLQFLYDGIFHLLAPEFKAIEFLLETVKN